jgi:sugar/nucleoside kinase (ribokinase family)
VALDVQGYTRRIKGQGITTGVSQRLPGVLTISQIIKLNQRELEAVLSYFDLDISALLKTYSIKECVATHGKTGGFVQDKKGNKHSYHAPQVESIADPTGAGDVFLAAYLLGRFLNKLNIADACRYAAKLSARQIRGRYINTAYLRLKKKTTSD